MSTRNVLVRVLGLVAVVGVAVFLLRDPPAAVPPPALAPAPSVDVEHPARLAGTGEDQATPDLAHADVATTLGAFRFQPPNVPAAAVARLRQQVDGAPALLEHLVRVALGDEPLRADLVPADYPYEPRQAVTWALEALGGPAARILGARLGTEADPGMRRAILWLLGRMGAGAAPAVEALRAAARDTARESRERGEAVYVLGAVGAAARPAADDLLALLRDPDDPVFGYALLTIYPVAGMTDAVRDAFVDLLAIDDTDVCVDVLDVVVQQMGADAEALRTPLLGLVEHGQADVRRMALYALQPVGVRQSRSLRLVVQRLEDGDEDEEAAALAVLLASGEAGRTALLEVAERTELVPLALRIGWGLSQDGASVAIPTQTLLRLFRECDPNVLHSVVALMDERPGGLEAELALPLLRAELGDPESDRRWAAAEALSAVRGDDHAVLGLLREALEDPEVRAFAFDALGRLQRLDAQVVPLLEAQAALHRFGAVQQLGTLAGESTLARSALQRLSTAEDAALSDFASRTLAEREGERAAR